MTTLESASGDQDLWHVEVAPGDVRMVTLDQLDDAFQDGLITEDTRVWQEGMACAVSLAELLGGGDEEEAPAEVEPYAAYVPPQSPPPASHAPESSWPPIVARTEDPPAASYPPPSLPSYSAAAVASYSHQYAAPSYPPRAAASYPPPAMSSYPPPASYAPPMSTPAPPSMAPMALDVPDYDIQYPRSGGKGKFVLAAFVVAAAAGAFALQKNGAFAGTSTSTVAAAAIVAPPTPPQPVSHAYDPGPPVKLGESKPPLALTVRDEPKADDKKAEASKVDDKKVDPKKAMASGKRPAPVSHSRRSGGGGGSKAGASNFKLGKSGSKYDPLNGSL